MITFHIQMTIVDNDTDHENEELFNIKEIEDFMIEDKKWKNVIISSPVKNIESFIRRMCLILRLIKKFYIRYL